MFSCESRLPHIKIIIIIIIIGFTGNFTCISQIPKSHFHHVYNVQWDVPLVGKLLFPLKVGEGLTYILGYFSGYNELSKPETFL